MELNTTRISAFDLGPIPWTAIIKYSEVYNLTYNDRDEFIFQIQLIDAGYSSFVKESENARRSVKPQKNSR